MRPYVDEKLFLQLAPTVQTNHCAKRETAKRNELTCPYCKKVGQSSLCFELHKRYRCRNVAVCKKCTRNIRLVGKYSRAVRRKPVDEHDNCEELYCNNCNDYVVGFENPRNPSHVCYVRPVTGAKQWPSLMVAFDFETFPCDSEGTMSVNMAHLITQKNRNEPNSDFVGVFFTDIPMDGVVLNGQEVRPGQEYTPDLDPKLRDYYPFKALSAELPKNEKTPETEVKKTISAPFSKE